MEENQAKRELDAPVGKSSSECTLQGDACDWPSKNLIVEGGSKEIQRHIRPCSFNPPPKGIGVDWRGFCFVGDLISLKPCHSPSKTTLTEQGLKDFDEDEIKEHRYGIELFSMQNFVRVSPNWYGMHTYGNTVVSEPIMRLKCTSDVHGVIGKIHQQGGSRSEEEWEGGLLTVGVQDTDEHMLTEGCMHHPNFEVSWALCISDDVQITSKHLQSKREMVLEDLRCLMKSQKRQEISKDKFIPMTEECLVKMGYSPFSPKGYIEYRSKRECLELDVTKYLGTTYFTRVMGHTSVRNKLVQLLLLVDWSVMEGRGDCSVTLQPQNVKDLVCYVSRTSGDTAGGRAPTRPVGTLKRRLCVVMTGSSETTPYSVTRSGRRLVISKRSIGLLTDNRSFRLLAAIRRHRRPPSLWIYDTGSSICVTGDLSLLWGVHNAEDISSAGVSGVELVSNKCGRIRSGRVKLSGIRYFPGAKVNLISGGILGSLGCEIIMNAKGCKIMKDGQVIGGGRMLPNRTYSVDFLDDKLLGGGICHHCRH